MSEPSIELHLLTRALDEWQRNPCGPPEQIRATTVSTALRIRSNMACGMRSSSRVPSHVPTKPAANMA